jgi:DivIVA domain-containing protein
MPLTPEDVHNKQFTTVRLREGYDEEEVDAFLDEVEGELTRLLRENEELRAKLAAATRAAAQAQQQAQQAQQQAAQQSGPMDRGGPGPMDRPPMDRAPVPMDRMPQRREPQPIPPQLPAPMPMAMAVPQQPQFPQVQPGGDSAARVLALAQQTADQAIAEARNEANKIVGEARTRADGLEREARNKAEALERDAQEKHRVAMGTLEQARSSLERKVEDLRAFEREYRQRLKSYLESQMRQLESNSSDDSALARSAGSSFGGGVPQLGPGSSAGSTPPPPNPSQPQPVPGMGGMSGGMSGGFGPGNSGMQGLGQSGPQPSYAAAAPNPGMPGQAPAMAGSAMSQMTQTMAPIRPGVPPQPSPVIPQVPSPMRGFLIDEDPEA